MTTATAYPYATGRDPQYDAWRAQHDFRYQSAWQDAAFGQQQATDSYNAAIAALDKQAAEGGRAIDTSMLQRGVYRSGETNRRQSDLTAEVLGRKEQAELDKTNTFAKISSDLQRAITMLNLENEQQISAAMSRAGSGGGGGYSGGGGGGGGGGSGGYGPGSPNWVPWLSGQAPSGWSPYAGQTPYVAPTPKPPVQPTRYPPVQRY